MELEDKKTWITGLVINCPFGKRVDGCRFKELSNLPLYESLTIVTCMSADERDVLIDHHRDCLQKRE